MHQLNINLTLLTVSTWTRATESKNATVLQMTTDLRMMG